MNIDKELQTKCRKQAIKHVAKSRGETQKHIISVMNSDYNPNVYRAAIVNAVKNWTVHYYNLTMQERYLK